MHRKFGVREKEPKPGEAKLMEVEYGCVVAGLCLIDGLTANACQYGGDYPYCNEKPQPTPEQVESAPCNPNVGDCGGGGSSGGGDSACTTCTPESAALSCTMNVYRGDQVVCNITGGAFESAGPWRWAASDGTAQVSASIGKGPWEGPGVKEGRVSVPVKQEGHTDTLRAFFTVTPRGWTWATHAESEYRDGTGEQCLHSTPSAGISETNDISRAQGLNLEIGVSCSTVRRMIQPDSRSTGDGFKVETVPGGPNMGLHYVVSATLKLRRESTYNLGLEPNARREVLKDVPGYATVDFIHSQRTMCGDSANWREFSTCMFSRYRRGEDPARYLAGLRAHEGRGTTGHNGHYSAAYDAIAAPANDPLIYFDDRVGSNTTTREEFTESIRQEFLRRANRADIASLDDENQGAIVGGNWTGPIWLWMPLEERFTQATHSN